MATNKIAVMSSAGERPARTAQLSVGDVVRQALGADVARLVASDPVARCGLDPEGVHQARVAARRLRSHLATFAPVLRASRATALRKELRWLGRALATVRDLDVLAGRLDADAEVASGATPGDGAVRIALADERAEADELMRELLRTPRYRSLLSSLGALVADPPFRRSAGLPAESFLLGAILERYHSLSDQVIALPASPTDEQLHEVRITAKPARYAAELGGPILGSACARLARRLTDLADHLGDLHDGARAIDWLDHVACDPHLAGAAARLRDGEVARIAVERAGWEHLWGRVRAAAAQVPWETPAGADGR